MNKTPKSIDYLDMMIRLPKGSENLVSEALTQFVDEYESMVLQPKLKGDLLKINSLDYIGLMGFLDRSKFSEFQWAQLKASATKELEQLLLKTTSADYQYHYKWCLAAMKNLEAGRFTENTE